MTRPQVIAFRVTPDEHSCLAGAAQAGGLTPSAWCRRAVLEQLAGGAAPPAAAAPSPPAAPVSFAGVAAAAAAAAEPLSRVAGAKLTRSQYFDLEARAKGAGMTVGTYLRRLIEGRPPTGRWPLARAAIVQLTKAGTNLNQLVKLAHGGTLLPGELHAAVLSVLAEVRRLRRALLEEPRE
ncbi:MAG TPA: plasmid mobilization relaxosome protein MobC [Thermoanaerobaculia bacterium]|nr:plasmid mobilization relaxosome protein MobC [Thermoanaerobaculia bacterium]